MVRNDINYMNSEIGRAELSAQFKLKQIHDITNSLLNNENSNNKPMKSDFTIGYMVAIINVIDYLSNNEDKHMDWTQKKPELTRFERNTNLQQLIIIFLNIFGQLYYITYWARNSLNSTGGKMFKKSGEIIGNAFVWLLFIAICLIFLGLLLRALRFIWLGY